MAPHFEQAAKQLEPNVRFAKLNTDDNPQSAARFGIRSIPTLILFRDGKEVARQAGALDSRRLTEWLRSFL
jgi:thioredoxin 2